MENYIIEKLDKACHARNLFDCGISILNTYLQDRANQEQKKRLNVTYVAIPSTSNEQIKPIVGYYTLSNSCLSFQTLPLEFVHGVPPTYEIPTIKIGRLAVDKSMQGRGFGKLLLKDACERIIDLAALSGIRGIEVIAKSKDIVSFYEAFGFTRLHQTNYLLFLPIQTLLNGKDES